MVVQINLLKMCIGVAANKEKIADLLVYLSSRIESINLKKLLKLIYLIDEHSVKERGIPVSWLEYKAWHYGPVAPVVYDIKNNGGIFADDLHVFKNEMGKYVILPKRKTELQQFSKKEMFIVDMVIAKYGDLTAEQLSELTHEPGGLWDSTVTRNKLSFEAGKDQSDIAINLRDLLSGSSLDSYNEAEECVRFQAELNKVMK